ncbi:MAG: hypothetical protein E6R08_06430 [Nevskiaceae bacterium]|nr:MAG: hypothetical protein E6R08_06430 [Nevskiaceae bacterium]
MNLIDSFFVALGFKTDTKGLDELKTQAEGAKTALMGVIGIATVAAAGITGLVHSVAEGMAEMNDFAEINEVSAAAVDALGKAAVQNNSSLDAVKSSIQGINRVIGEAAIGVGRGAKTFEKLGLSAKDSAGNIKDANAMMNEVADKIAGKSRQEQIATLEKLGIDRSMIMMMKDGAEEFQKIKDDALGNAIFTDADYARADEISKLFVKAKGTVGAFTKQIAVGLFPVVQNALKGYLDWFKASKKATADTFLIAVKALAAGIAFLWDWVMRLATGVKSLAQWLMSFKTVTYAAYVALALFLGLKTYSFFVSTAAAIRVAVGAMWAFARATAAASLSAVLIPAAIGLILLALVALVDEIVNFKEGNESFIGDLVAQYPMLGQAIQMMSDAIAAVWQYLVDLFNTIQPALAELASAWFALMMAFGPLLEIVWQVFKVVASFLIPIFLFLATVVLQAFAGVIGDIATMLAWIVTKAASAVKFIAEFFTVGFTAVRDFVFSIFNAIGEFIDKWVGKIGGVIKWVGGLVGSKEVTGAVNTTLTNGGNTPGAVPSAGTGSSLPSTTNAPIGVAATPQTGRGNTTVTAPTTITASIQVNSSDPNAAGKSVKDALENWQRDGIRNAQSAVRL